MAKIVKSDDFKRKVDLKTRVDFEDRADFFEEVKLSPIVSKKSMKDQGEVRSVLEEARDEALKIKKEARELLEQVQQETERARREGDARGYQEGLERALEYLSKIHLLREKMFQDIEPQVLKLVFEIVEKILQQKLEEDQVVLGIVKKAIESAMGNKMLVRIHPEDLKTIKENEALLLSKLDSSRTVSFREDELIKRGGCVVETEVGAMDAQLHTQLSAIKKAMGFA